jgi:TPR repeat protein
LEAFRIDNAPRSKVIRHFNLNSDKRPKLRARLARVGDNYSDEVAEDKDYKNGVTAYQQGDYSTALRLWKSLAEQGYVNAQFNLGQMYEVAPESRTAG